MDSCFRRNYIFRGSLKNLKNISPKASSPFFSHLLLGDCDSHKFIIDAQACFFYTFSKPIRNEGDA